VASGEEQTENGATPMTASPSDTVVSNAAPTVAASFSGKRTAEIVGITYRQLDYWARTDLVRPSLADANGSGTRRRYSYKDLLELKVIKTLLDAGIRLESVREVFSFMREQLGEDVASANLVIHGSTSVLTRSGEELIDLVRKGQGVLNVLPLAGIKDEVDAKIVELQPTRPQVGTEAPEAPEAPGGDVAVGG